LQRCILNLECTSTGQCLSHTCPYDGGRVTVRTCGEFPPSICPGGTPAGSDAASDAPADAGADANADAADAASDSAAPDALASDAAHD
jgi:hypothetical protein